MFFEEVKNENIQIKKKKKYQALTPNFSKENEYE